MTKVEERKRSTYRFNRDLEKAISEEAMKLGVSKNAYVQIKLTQLLQSEKGKSENSSSL